MRFYYFSIISTCSIIWLTLFSLTKGFYLFLYMLSFLLTNLIFFTQWCFMPRNWSCGSGAKEFQKVHMHFNYSALMPPWRTRDLLFHQTWILLPKKIDNVKDLQTDGRTDYRWSRVFTISYSSWKLMSDLYKF